jgi:hypothetical protein
MDEKMEARSGSEVTLQAWKVALMEEAMVAPEGLRSRMWMVQLGRWERAVATARPMPDAVGC